MRRDQSAIRWLALAALWAATADAQSSDTLLRPDARVLLWSSARGYHRTPAVLLRRDPDSLLLRVTGQASPGQFTYGETWVGARQIDSLRVRVHSGISRRTSLRKGAFWGGIVGFAGGAIAVLSDKTFCDKGIGPCLLPAALVGGLYGAMGVAVGAPAGLIVAELLSTRWQRVPWEPAAP